MASGMGINRRALVQRLVLAIVFSTAILGGAASAKAQGLQDSLPMSTTQTVQPDSGTSESTGVLDIGEDVNGGKRISGSWTFAQANGMYERGQYDSAALAYQYLLGQNSALVSPQLYYNLGNAYFRMRNYARAILNYERALKYSPNYEDARFNLELARTFTVDRIAAPQDLPILRWFRGFYHILSPIGWGILALVSVAVLLASVLAMRFLRNRRVWILSLIIGLFGLAVTLLSFTLGRIAARQMNSFNAAVVMPSVVSVKGEPSAGGKDLFLLHAGTKVQILDQLGEWLEVAVPDGHRGWLQRNEVEKI